MTAPGPVGIRVLGPEDAAAARALVESEIGGTPYGELPRSALDDALAGDDREALGRVATIGGELAGVILYGLVAGTVGASRLMLVAVTAAARLRGVAGQLVDAALVHLAQLGARFAEVEFPDDPALRPGRLLLLRAGFAEESRVKDFFRDGVDLVFLRKEIG